MDTPRGKPHIYVPMPKSSFAYGDSMKRDQLIRRYGEVSVMHAEVSACVSVMILLGIIKKTEFVELVENALQSADKARQRQAESGGKA